MNETTEVKEVFYDDTCQFCIRTIGRLRGLLERYQFRIQPLADGSNATEMKATDATGRSYGGVDAILFVASQIWWARPFARLGALPSIHRLLDRVYRAIAARRHCQNGQCELPAAKPDRTGTQVSFIALGVPIAWTLTEPGTLRMWSLATLLWLGFKVYAMRGTKKLPIAWWLWPGMDANAFATPRQTEPAPWLLPTVRIAIGLALLGVAQRLEPIPAGWCGMAALLLILHFGIFDLLARFWQRRGHAVRPIMDAPWQASTLAAFWGNRWNRAFSDVTRTLLFRPLVRRYGVATGTLAGFAFSGLLHELVIAAPAGGGYGLATGYFLIQGIAVLLERRLPFAPHRGYVAFFVLAPAYWLFHPTFMERVIAPMIQL